jgi:hypothetical protein
MFDKEKMTSSLERRVERLEGVTHVGADVDRARAIFNAYEMVSNHPEKATDDDRALAGITSHEDWSPAFGILIDHSG